MPHSSDSRSVENLKREAERSRRELTQSVHQIRDAVSDATSDLSAKIAPRTIKANIGDYVRARGEDMLEAARRNPLQAAAVAAIAAYPGMAIARRIPAPLMMIGAGLFLMSSEAGRDLSRRATEGAGDLAEQGQRMAQDWRKHSADTLASVGASIRSSVSETAGAASQYAAQTRSDIADGIAASQRDMRDAAHGLTSSARDLGGNAVGSTNATAVALANWARENSMMAAAIGMAAGGLVASALPVTRAEARLTETAGGDLRRRLRDAESQGVTTATEAVEQIHERTSQQGLTPQAIAEAARDFGERALKVAEAAADAALSRADGQNDSPNPAGG